MVDIDPQANASSGVGINHRELPQGIYESIINGVSIKDIIVNTGQEFFRVAPSTISLAGAGVELVGMERREFRLYDALMEVRNDYDYIIIDCPPSLDLVTLNGLISADDVLIPVQAEYYALEGLGQLLNTIQLIKENIKPNLDILGAVITMFDKRNRISDQVMNELYQYFPNKIFRTVIPRNVRLTEAPSHGKSILEYDPRSKGARAYEKLAREILEAKEYGY